MTQLINHPKEMEKAYRKIDVLVKAAKRERDQKGYRENLGYDSIHKLREFLETLSLDYSEKYWIEERFWNECDAI